MNLKKISSFGFTPRELDVAKLLSTGIDRYEIGEQLKISPLTVDGMLVNIRRKMGTSTTLRSGCLLAKYF